MPRNDQVTRQWLLMQKLEQSHGATVQELATSIPEDLSRHPRTIRRDLEALEAAHIPLVTERQQRADALAADGRLSSGPSPGPFPNRTHGPGLQPGFAETPGRNRDQGIARLCPQQGGRGAAGGGNELS